MYILFFVYFSSTYPDSIIHCRSEYLQKARPELDDIRYVFVQDTYDSFVENCDNRNYKYKDLVQPDFIAILNCGFIFYDSWNKSIPYLFKFPNTPVIFTEYQRQDAESNLEKVKTLGKQEII